MVIIDSNKIIKLAKSIHLGNDSFIVVECITLKDDILDAIYNDFTNLKIERDSKIIINCYNRKSSSWLVGYYGTRGLVEVCVSWPGHPRYLKKKK